MGLLKPAGKPELSSLEIDEMRGDGGDENCLESFDEASAGGGSMQMMEMVRDHGDKLAVDP